MVAALVTGAATGLGIGYVLQRGQLCFLMSVSGSAVRQTRSVVAVGGFLLGAGGWIAGGCNLGHGLSGAAQLNVSSWVVVASMAAGVGLPAAAARGHLIVRAPPGSVLLCRTGRGTCLGPGRTMRECVPFASGAA